MRYWMNIVSRPLVETGAAGGFTEAEEGRQSRLKRLSRGDTVVFYSGTPHQRFTGIGSVADDDIFQAGTAWRRRVDYADCREAPVQPLIGDLEFITNKKSWGVAFRRGFFEIAESDYRKIAEAMAAPTIPA